VLGGAREGWVFEPSCPDVYFLLADRRSRPLSCDVCAVLPGVIAASPAPGAQIVELSTEMAMAFLSTPLALPPESAADRANSAMSSGRPGYCIKPCSPEPLASPRQLRPLPCSGSRSVWGSWSFNSITTPLKTANAFIISASATSRLKNQDVDCDLDV
jgi:hypothetical protein